MRSCSVVVVGLVVGLVSRAAADPCKGAEPVVRSVARELQGLSRSASEANLTCGFHGASPELVDKLRGDAKSVAADEQAVTKWETCKVSPSELTAVGLVSSYETWMSQTFMAALDVCGPKQGAAAAPPSPNAACEPGEAWLLSWARRMEDTAAKATEIAVTCAFKGPSDRLLTDLARKMKPQIQKLIKTIPKTICHSGVFSGQTFMETQAESASKRLGLAVGLCSSKAHKKLVQLRRSGPVTSEDASTALESLAMAYLKTVFGEMGQ